MAAPKIALEIDAAELNSQIKRLQDVMEPEQFTRAMHGIFIRTGSHVSTILRKEIPEQYQVKKSDMSAVVKKPQLSFDATGVGCTIPLSGARRTIGTGFKATGGRRSSVGSNRKANSARKKYVVSAKILKSGASPIQDTSSYGGQPAFRNLDYGPVAFTRRGKKRLPISKISGIAIPQMPMNRSAEDVQRDIREYLEERIEARFQAMIKNGR